MRILLVCLILFSGVAFAQSNDGLTDTELVKVRQIIKQVDMHTIPLQIEQLKKEREALIVERDNALYQEDVKMQDAKQVILSNYEVQIDAKEADIDALNNQLITP